jgi:hypothetical protein
VIIGNNAGNQTDSTGDRTVLSEVSGTRMTDARRIVAAINGVRGIPTEALETWMVKDVSDPDHRPDDLDVSFYDEGTPSPHAVPPPGEPAPAEAAPIPDLLPFDRRVIERRQGRGGKPAGEGRGY